MARDTGQTIFLSVARADRVICIDWSPGQGFDVLLLKPGRSLPLHAGAEGRTALAFGPDDPAGYLAQAPFPRLTDRTLVTAAELHADVAATRARGFSISDEDATDGIGAFGVPIRTSNGVLSGVLSLAGLAATMRSGQTDFIDRLRSGADALARMHS